MSAEIKFYHNPASRGRIAHWMLEEVGVPYEVELVDLAKGQQKEPGFLAVNPMGKLPAIVHRGVVVTETPAICAYLADAFPAANLAPGLDDPRRGAYLRWLFFGASCVEYAMVDRMFGRPAPDRPGALGYGSYDAVMSTLEAALTSGPFLLGEQFTAADVYVGSQIGWGFLTKAVEPRPAFQAYVARLFARPAAQRAGARDKAFREQMEG